MLFTDIPTYVRGSSIAPLRVQGDNTTASLQTIYFKLIVAPDCESKANSELCIDYGDNLVQMNVTEASSAFDGKMLVMGDTFEYDVGDVTIANVMLLGDSRRR